jgi:nucleotide-binding universal stress UspA family protein
MLPQHWIVGTDLSAGSDAALRLAVAWAHARGGTLEVVHAIDEAVAGEDRARLDEALGDQVQRAGGDELASPPVVSLHEGEPRDVLTRRAGARAGIVVGAEGSSAMLLRQAGRVPAALATATSVPLLVAPLGWHGPERRRRRAPAGSGAPRRRRDVVPAFSRLMTGCSLTPRDAARVAHMADLAQPGHRLMLAHSIDLSRHRDHPPSLRASARARSLAAARKAESLLCDLATEAVPLELAAADDVLIHVVRQGPPERDLAGLADSQSASLLLVGTGSLAARLLGLSTAPLLVLP